MRIISDFHDYYDGVMKYGTDSSNIYFRKELSIKSKDRYSLDFKNYIEFFEQICERKYFFSLIRRPYIYIHRFFILFAGELFPVLEYGLNYYYSYDELMTNKILNEHCTDSQKKQCKEFYDIKVSEKKIIDYHVKVKSPIIVYSLDSHEVTINCKLKDYKFFKVIEPFQAYQKIEMFTTNHLIDIIPIKDIADIDKISKHGFDKKSFRRM